MDIQALFTLAALCCKNGRNELALQVLEQACNCEEFSSVLNSSLQPAFQSCGPAQVGCNEASGADGDGMDGFNSYVDDVNVMMPNANHGGTSPSENTWSPSLHGNDSSALGQIVSIASAVHAHKRFLEDGESLIVDPQLLAISSSVDLEPYDDESLVRKNHEVSVPLQPGRVTIKL